MNDQLDVATWIRQLEEERDRLSLLIEEARRRSGMASSSDAGGAVVAGRPSETNGSTGQIRPDEFFRMSIREAIRKLLEIMKRPQTPKAIVEGLRAGGVLSEAKHFYANTFTELKRMEARGLVANTSNGWGLAEWYPSKPKQAEPTKAKRKRKAGPGKPKQRLKGVVSKTKTADTAAGSRPRQAVLPPVPSPLSAPSAEMERATTWHQFLGAAVKTGRSMEQAGIEWRQRKDTNK